MLRRHELFLSRSIEEIQASNQDELASTCFTPIANPSLFQQNIHGGDLAIGINDC